MTSWGDGAEEGLVRAGDVRLAGFFTDSGTPSDVMEEPPQSFHQNVERKI